ncbi:MAG: hypothetical protein R2731_00075 [Nocardioides sp.]
MEFTGTPMISESSWLRRRPVACDQVDGASAIARIAEHRVRDLLWVGDVPVDNEVARGIAMNNHIVTGRSTGASEVLEGVHIISNGSGGAALAHPRSAREEAVHWSCAVCGGGDFRFRPCNRSAFGESFATNLGLDERCLKPVGHGVGAELEHVYHSENYNGRAREVAVVRRVRAHWLSPPRLSTSWN